MNLLYLLVALIGYLFGSIPFSFLITRWKIGKDIRHLGSKNVGATNVMRTTGKSAGILALMLDTSKGAAAVVLGQQLGNDPIWGAIGGFFAIVGHSFPVFLGFRGGKSVATGAGAFLILSPLGILSSIGLFLILLMIFRIVSLSSIIASGSFPLFAWLYGTESGVVMWGAASALWIVLRHHQNIMRLIRGTERKMGDRKE